MSATPERSPSLPSASTASASADASHTEHSLPSAGGDNPDVCLLRGDHVLRPRSGIGPAAEPSRDSEGTTAAKLRNGRHNVTGPNLPRLLPVTVLARAIEATGSPVTAWAVRKANEQGRIQPDAIGRCAGHKVHYYDAARIPALLQQLSEPDPWSIDALVMHPRYGPGRIAGYRNGAARLIEFFSGPSPVSVPVAELRRLVPSHTMAKSVGVNRRSFPTLAASRGIYPDYVAPYGRVREFYDESRTVEIRSRWTAPQGSDRMSPGRIVLDAEGEIVRIQSRDTRGQAHVRNIAVGRRMSGISPCPRHAARPMSRA
jgi:hypothetical protein